MATKHLGSFGVQHEEQETTFDYFGEDLRVHPDLTDLAFVDLFSAMAAPKDGEAAIAALRAMVAALVHPDDAERFWVVARANRQTMEDVANLAVQLIGALSGRPTQPPSDSSESRRTDDTSSLDDVSLQALQALGGRPDLQAAVLRAR